MKLKQIIPILLLIAGFVLVGTGIAQAYTIDGDLSDWGVNPSTSNWVPNPGVYYSEEDYVGEGGFVGPGWGWQRFDAEALYLDWDNTNLYLALVTGFPETGVTIGTDYYSAGDIAIDFGVDGTYEYGIEIGGHNPDGYWGFEGDDPGDVFKDIYWVNGTYYPESNPLYMGDDPDDPTFVDSASDFAYNRDYYGSPDTNYDRWVVEMSVPRDVFGDDWNNYMSIHWTQSCGNDNINVTTPEPMSMALLGAGLFGLLGSRLRKRKK